MGYFANNVFRPTARVLSGLEWKVQPPKFTHCPEDAVETPSSAAPVPAKVASCFQVQLLNTFLVIMGFIL